MRKGPVWPQLDNIREHKGGSQGKEEKETFLEHFLCVKHYSSYINLILNSPVTSLFLFAVEETVSQSLGYKRW